MSTLEFWFDFGSPYSYFSALRIVDMCKEHGIQLQWRPFLLGPIFRTSGWETSPFVVYPNKGKYMWRDVERLAEKYSRPYKKPSTFPQNGLLAARIALAAQGEDWISAFIISIFQAEFEAQKDISNSKVIENILQSIGVNANEWFQKAVCLKNKEALRLQTEEASEKGIFGAPTFLIGKELFWGNDRLEDACRFALGLDSKVRSSLEEFCDAWLNSWSGNQPEKLLDYYTEDVFYSDPARPKGLSGKSSLREYFVKLLAKNPDWKWARTRLFPNEEGFTLRWTAKIPRAKDSISISGMDRVVLRDSKISRNEVYFDPRSLFEV